MVVDWPARMQRMTHGKLIDLAPPASEIWLDGGHNPGAVCYRGSFRRP